MPEKKYRQELSSSLIKNSSYIDLNQLWQDNPNIVRQFLEQRPDYEHLCDEVTYILEKRLKDHGIEVSTISSRAKSLSSFLEKIQRKHYPDPFMDIQDFAGIRVVYLYRQDAEKIEDIIHKEFEVLERTDKLEEKDSDRFGYLAMHFICRLGPKSLGARFEDLKKLVFELQVRTVLQDAWAIIDHHLAYKHESEVPQHLQRKLTRIAGMFEMVDEDFDEIRLAIDTYIFDLNKLSKNNAKQFLEQKLDLNSFQAYLEWKFPNLPLANRESTKSLLEFLFNKIDQNKYPDLLQLDKIIESAKKYLEKVSEIERNRKVIVDDALNQFLLSLAIADEDFRNQIPDTDRQIIERVLKKGPGDGNL